MTLRIDQLSKSFGAVQVLQHISLNFAPGEVTAIIGDNGAGKSTLLKMFTGIHFPDAGRITLADADLTNLAADERRAHGIEMVYQDLALARQQDVVANLWLGRELVTKFGFLKRKAMEKQAREELETFGINIPDLLKPIGLLSGGQQQAVAIARAVLFDPKVLLLDEPTAALAVREVEQVLSLIRQEKEKGRIVVLVSHRLNDVFAVADRIVVMKQGRVQKDLLTHNTSLSEIIENIVG